MEKKIKSAHVILHLTDACPNRILEENVSISKAIRFLKHDIIFYCLKVLFKNFVF